MLLFDLYSKRSMVQFPVFLFEVCMFFPCGVVFSGFESEHEWFLWWVDSALFMKCYKGSVNIDLLVLSEEFWFHSASISINMSSLIRGDSFLDFKINIILIFRWYDDSKLNLNTLILILGCPRFDKKMIYHKSHAFNISRRAQSRAAA